MVFCPYQSGLLIKVIMKLVQCHKILVNESHNLLTYIPLDKMVGFSQTIFTGAFVAEEVGFFY